jgi:hypothetical protein
LNENEIKKVSIRNECNCIQQEEPIHDGRVQEVEQIHDSKRKLITKIHNVKDSREDSIMFQEGEFILTEKRFQQTQMKIVETNEEEKTIKEEELKELPIEIKKKVKAQEIPNKIG